MTTFMRSIQYGMVYRQEITHRLICCSEIKHRVQISSKPHDKILVHIDKRGRRHYSKQKARIIIYMVAPYHY